MSPLTLCRIEAFRKGSPYDGRFRRIGVGNRRVLRTYDPVEVKIMDHRWLEIIGGLLPILLVAQAAQGADAQTGKGPYARIAMLRPLDGHTVDFEAGYVRHLEWHRQAKDPFTWYGWSVWASERQRWFVYATFGHAAADFDRAVSPAEDERDNVMNVVPHAEFTGNAFYEFLPALSRGTGEPQQTPRLEMMTVDLVPGKAKELEAALSADQSRLRGETLWYRMVAGGPSARYLRLRPMPNVAAILEDLDEQRLPETVNPLMARVAVEILSLRQTMSYNLPTGK
jgi:hypothetical protein